MALSKDLIAQFVKITNDKPETKNESTVYGTIVESNGSKCVQIDGSDIATPIQFTTNANAGDRVTVMIKNHTAIVTGNLSSPSARSGDIQDQTDQITQLGILVANKVDTDVFVAESGRIDDLVADNVLIREELLAGSAIVESLSADNVVIKETLTAHTASIDALEANMLTADVAAITYAKISELEVVEGNFHTLDSDYAAFKSATADTLNVHTAAIRTLTSGTIDTETLNATYATIDFSNIGQAAMEHFYSASGLIEDVTVSDGTITGRLVGVTLKGDLIEGNTIVAEKLVIKGADGLYYKLNTDGVTTEAEQTEYNSLNGSVILAKSVTAEKISVDDLVAFDATIGGINIANGALYSGVKSSVDNTAIGLYMDKHGQMAVGDANKFFKYYTDANGVRRLEISADTLKFGSSNKSVETAIDDIQIGGRNLILNSSFEGLDDVTASTYSIVYSPTERMVTFTSTATGTMPGCYTRLTEYGRINLRGSKLTLSGEYKVLTALEFGSTNPWVGYQLSIARNDTTGGSSQYINWLGGTAIGTEVTDTWVKFSATYDITDYEAVSAGVSILFRDVIGSVQFRNLKVEFGNKVTDWTQAPEDLDKAIEEATNISVGGRNYIVTSNLSSYSVYNSTPVAENGIISTTYQSTYAPDASSYLTLGVTGYTPPNEVMTLSGFIKINGVIPESNYFTTRASTYGPSDGNISEYDPSTGYFRFTQTYNGDSPWIIHAQTTRESGSSDVITFEKLKFEKGNRPTDWTPAPEDMATADEVSEAASTATDAQTRVAAAEALIEILSESISMLVTDGNGASLMTQTENGWTFSTGAIQELVDRTSEGLNDLTRELGDTNSVVDILQQAVDDLGAIAEYVKIGTYEDEPCIELGEGDSDFKLRITNTRMIFTEGSVVLAYFNNQSLHIKKAIVEEELQQGGFVWKVRSNGNMGLVWKGVTS